MNLESTQDHNKLDSLQRVALGLMAAITLVTFVAANLQAALWHSSDWLVSTVLPAVVIDLTNDERGGYAAAPLQRNSTLDAAAAQKAAHMAQYSYFSHYAPDGTSPWYFFDQAGYVYAHAGENLAIHFTDSSQVVDAWMDSPAHKENIVNRDFAEIGVGTARGVFDGHETIFVVQLFGTPAVAPTVAPTPSLPLAAAETVPTPEEDRLAQLQSELAALQTQAEVLQDTPQQASVEAGNVTEEIQPTPSPVTVAVSGIETAAPTPDEQPRVVLPQAPVFDAPSVVIQTELSTSSGLAVAQVFETSIENTTKTEPAIASIATRPGLVLDVIYSLLVSAVLVLILISFISEARRFHFVQAAYSVALLAGLGGLWYLHTTLTSGAVVA